VARSRAAEFTDFVVRHVLPWLGTPLDHWPQATRAPAASPVSHSSVCAYSNPALRPRPRADLLLALFKRIAAPGATGPLNAQM
jgi:hypothetical protein